MALFKKHHRANQAEEIDFSNLPRHIAIIMDGNGRWAKQRGLPRSAGHASGSETFRRVATYCKNIGIEYLTVYAFSTENWKRPKEEVDSIMNLLEKYLLEAIEQMERDRVKMAFFGNIEQLPERLRELIRQTEEISTHYEGCQVNICVNYGGRDELIRAINRYTDDVRAGEQEPLTEEKLSGYLYSAGVPDPDILIRPGGEYRISNFLLWQCAYTEFYFTDVLWPDFNEQELNRAISAYQHRERRYGGIL